MIIIKCMIPEIYPKIGLTGYSFNFQISTDGFSTSINFIKNDEIEKKNKKSKLMVAGCKKN